MPFAKLGLVSESEANSMYDGEEAGRVRRHLKALQHAEQDAETWAAQQSRPKNYPLPHLRLTRALGYVRCSVEGSEELSDLATDALRLVGDPAPTWSTVKRIAAIAKREQQRAAIYTKALADRSLEVGLITRADHPAHRQVFMAAVGIVGQSSNAIRYAFSWNDELNDHGLVTRLPKEFRSLETWQIVAALALVWISESVVLARHGEWSAAIEAVAAAGNAMSFASEAGQSRRDYFDSKAARKQLAEQLAKRRHSPLNGVRDEIVAKYKRGSYKSANQAAHALAPAAIGLSRSAGRPLAEFNAQKTVYAWLLASNKDHG